MRFTVYLGFAEVRGHMSRTGDSHFEAFTHVVTIHNGG